MRYVKVTRNDAQGSYIQPVKELEGCVQGEFDGIDSLEPGTSITLTVVEMSEEEYANLPEFDGW